MERELPAPPEPADVRAAAEALATAVDGFLMGTPPADWPLALVEALDAYVKAVGVDHYRGVPRGRPCPLCEGSGRLLPAGKRNRLSRP